MSIASAVERLRRFDPRAAAVRVAWMLLTAAATFAVLVASDKLAGYYFEGIRAIFPPQYIAVYLLLALSISLSRGRWFRLAAVGFLVLLQVVWLSAVAYTGSFLRPEMVKLSFVQAFEVNQVIAGEIGVFFPAVVAAVLVFGALLAVQEKVGARRAWRSVGGNLLFLLLIAFAFTRAGTMGNTHVVYPSIYTPSIVGTVNSVMLALRPDFGFYAENPTPNADAYSYRDIGIAEEPVTVAVIMGESIAPLRMSVYGGRGIATTPRLEELAAADDGYVLIPKLGFSAGYATLGSIPTFLNAIYRPEDVFGGGDNLIVLARKQGFATAYLSVQKIRSLELAGGIASVDVLETLEPWSDRVDEIRDDILLDHLNTIPGGAARQFIFLHQRVNHTAYPENCPAGFDASAVMGTGGDAMLTGDRQRGYDTGLVCYDRSVAMLLERLRQREGALYVFITADHNELMGEQGLYGHLIPFLEVGLVPMMLYTNRPGSAIAADFRKRRWITAFEMAQMVVASFGTEMRVADYRPGEFYVNGILPYGGAGFLRVSENPDGSFRVVNVLADGSVADEKESVRLSEAAYRFNASRYARGAESGAVKAD